MSPTRHEDAEPTPDVRITVTDMDGTVLDSWERELPDVHAHGRLLNMPAPHLARVAIKDLASDIRDGVG